MREIRTSGLMSGDGKRSNADAAQATAPVLDSTGDDRLVLWSGGFATVTFRVGTVSRSAGGLLRREGRWGLRVAVEGFCVGRLRPRRSGDEPWYSAKNAAQDGLIRAGCRQVHADLGLQLDHPGGDLDEAPA